MSGPRAAQNLQMPHPRVVELSSCRLAVAGARLSAAGIDWYITRRLGLRDLTNGTCTCSQVLSFTSPSRCKIKHITQAFPLPKKHQLLRKASSTKQYLRLLPSDGVIFKQGIFCFQGTVGNRTSIDWIVERHLFYQSQMSFNYGQVDQYCSRLK